LSKALCLFKFRAKFVLQIFICVNNELVINSTPTEVVIALLKDKRMVELHREKRNNAYSVGDIYLGRVKKVMPGLNAAFVDVGYEKDAFLHYLDLGPQVHSLNKFVKMTRTQKQNHSSLMYFKIENDISKDGKIGQILQQGQEIMVQIAKEPISTKGPRISSEISLAGRYIVLVPFSDRVSVSQKIRNSEEKTRLKNLIQSIKPKNFGVIVRTVAENKKVADLDADMKDLVSKWESCFHELKSARPPHKILGELDRTSAFLRDMLNSSYNSIYVDEPVLYDEMKSYLQTIAPDKEKILKLYKGDLPVFESFGIEKQIKALFGKTVNMKTGAYLIIEHTEALHVIDVNSGNRAKSEFSQETNALEVNLEAAAEIARQLRLRDMGGIIVVDFIDLHDAENRKILFQKMKDEMATDKAKHTILPPSKFGLIQITRQRVRPEMDIKTSEKCPACDGTGEVQASILIIDEIENNLRYIIEEQNASGLSLSVHPFIEAYLTKGIISTRVKWFLKYKKWIKIQPMTSYHALEYHFFNKENEEIKL
jgi:ribonuclease G